MKSCFGVFMIISIILFIVGCFVFDGFLEERLSAWFSGTLSTLVIGIIVFMWLNRSNNINDDNKDE